MSHQFHVFLFVGSLIFTCASFSQENTTSFPTGSELNTYQLKLIPDEAYALKLDQDECWFSFREGLLLHYLIEKGGKATIAEVSRYTNGLSGPLLRKDSNPPKMTRKAVTSLNKKSVECFDKKIVEKETATKISLFLDSPPTPSLEVVGPLGFDKKSSTAFLKTKHKEWQLLELPDKAHQFLVSVIRKLEKDPYYLFGSEDILPYSYRTRNIQATFNYHIQLIEKEFTRYSLEISASALGTEGFFIHIEGLNDEIRDTFEDPSGSLEVNFFDRQVRYKKSLFSYPSTVAPLWYYLFPAKRKAYLTTEEFKFLLPSFNAEKWAITLFRSVGRVNTAALPSKAQRLQMIAYLHSVEAPATKETTNSIPTTGNHSKTGRVFVVSRERFFEYDFCPLEISLFELYQVIKVPEAGITIEDKAVETALKLLAQVPSRWVSLKGFEDKDLEQKLKDLQDQLQLKAQKVEARKNRLRLHQLLDVSGGKAQLYY